MATGGHGPLTQKDAFSCGQGYKEVHLQKAASKGDGLLL